MPDFLSNTSMKVALAILVVLMGAVFFWQPLKMVLSGTRVTNDFVLQTADGPFDTRTQRGKALAIVFAYAGCGDACKPRLTAAAKAFDQLGAAERNQARLLLITVDPEHDTPARIRDYAKGIHPEMIGATGAPADVKAIADAFGADYKALDTRDGSTVIQCSPLTFIVDADGRFVSVLNESIPTERAAASLRGAMQRVMPPSK